jgi:hypothetical protein
MPRTILRQETIEGTVYNVVEDSDIIVCTGPTWLFNQFKDYTHPVKPWLKIIPVIDPNGKPIIGQSVLDDPNWDYLAENPINYSGQSKPVREWLQPIPFVSLEPVEP